VVGAAAGGSVRPSIHDFDIIKPISRGSFGSVLLGRKKSTGDIYAIKVVKKSSLIEKNQMYNPSACCACVVCRVSCRVLCAVARMRVPLLDSSALRGAQGLHRQRTKHSRLHR
jgi:serine/threonine protein kinase